MFLQQVIIGLMWCHSIIGRLLESKSKHILGHNKDYIFWSKGKYEDRIELFNTELTCLW